MQYLMTPNEVWLAGADLIRDHGADLPAVTYGTLAAYTPSFVDRTVFCCEALWAVIDQVPPAAQTFCGQLARIAQMNGFHELGSTDRAARMVLGVRRRLGELTEDEAPAAGDPAPLDEYVPPEA